MWLLFYLLIGTVYSSILNSYYVWFLHAERFRGSITLLKMAFPLAMLVLNASIEQYCLLIYLINLVGSLFAGFLLYFHTRNLLRGRLTHEKNKQFNFGRIENIRIVLGERWHLTWISPFIRSPLPHDGINWQREIGSNAMKSS